MTARQLTNLELLGVAGGAVSMAIPVEPLKVIAAVVCFGVVLYAGWRRGKRAQTIATLALCGVFMTLSFLFVFHKL